MKLRIKHPFVVVLLAAACLAVVTPALAGASKPSKTTTTVKHHAKKTKKKPGGNGSSLSSPIPLGSFGNVDGWHVKVISVAPEAEDTLLHTPPPAGWVFEVYTIQGTWTGPQPMSIIELNPGLVGASHVSRGPGQTPDCYGGMPDNSQAYKGGTLTDGTCISVKSTDAAGKLVMVMGELHPTYFATK